MLVEKLIKEYSRIIRENKPYMNNNPDANQRKLDREYIKSNHGEFGKGVHNENCTNSMYEYEFMDFLWDYEEYIEDDGEYISLNEFEKKKIESFIDNNSYSGE